ncbi:claudin-4-like [Genypterus blacodes]|uniref:claudin-4-like n=1 Tax=Genypterus blacodes TaxID=154954 RepID=UPI003F7745EC
MDRRLELAGLGLAMVGWFCCILTRCVALWKVSGTLDNSTATLPAYWDGALLEWDHWDLNHDLLSLSGSFRTWRTLIEAAIGVGAFAVVMGAVGAVWFPQRGQVKVASGTVFVLAGLLLLVPIAWTCHHTSQPLEGAVLLRRDWGPALFLGWIAIVLMVLGGGVLMTRCPNSASQGQQNEGTTPKMEERAPNSASQRQQNEKRMEERARNPMSGVYTGWNEGEFD